MQYDHTTVKSLQHSTIIILGVVTLLLVISSLSIYSASAVFALEAYKHGAYFLYKQLTGIVIGLLVSIVLQSIPYEIIIRAVPIGYISACLLTAATLIPQMSRRIHGSSRWLKVGITFQPSELLTIMAVLVMAYVLAHSVHTRNLFLKGYLPIFLVLIPAALILLAQPDFGMTVTLLLTAAIMLFIADARMKHLMITLCGAMPLGIVLVLMHPYRIQRILTFLNPWKDPSGSGFQVVQSLIAIGSGGWLGRGWGHSHQKFFYLPMQHTDFIFSIIAEELGFLGSTIIIVLFLLFIRHGLRIATLLRDPFCKYATAGFVTIISLHALMNIAVTLGIIPTKGVGLPFVSYGNTSLVCHLLMIAYIVRFVRHERHSSIHESGHLHVTPYKVH